MPSLSHVRHVVFFSRNDLDPEVLSTLKTRLDAQGITYTMSPEECDQRPDLMISLGGDGTLLRASAWAAQRKIPVLGINYGTLGFLTAFRASEMEEAVTAIADRSLRWEERIRMRILLVRDKEVIGSWCALNDAVVKHGNKPGLITVRANIDGHEMATYKADGLLVSTPTGSTAYNLAVGGPILYPTNTDFVISPISPHCVTHRNPIVVSTANEIEIVYLGPEGRDAMLTMDGFSIGLEQGDRIQITGHCLPLRLCPSHHSISHIMREKFGWGGHGA